VLNDKNDALVVAPFSGEADRRDPTRQYRRRGGRRITDVIPAAATLPKKSDVA
jgi:hypothetical protein